MRPNTGVAVVFSKCVSARGPGEKSTACGRVDGRTALFSWEKSTERFMKYRNGSPYVAVIRLSPTWPAVYPKYEVDVSRARTLPCVQ